MRNSTSITIDRRFDVTAAFTTDWFRSYATELANYSGKHPEDDVYCYVSLNGDYDNRIEFRNRNAWLDYIIQNWNNVWESQITQYGGVVVRARCQHRRHHIVFAVEGENQSDIEQMFDKLCDALSLAVSPLNPYTYRRSSLEFEIGNWRPDLFVSGVQGIAKILGTNPEVAEAYAKSFEGDIEKLTPFFDLDSFDKGVGGKASRFGEMFVRMQARSIGVGIGVSSNHKKLRIRTNIAPDDVDKLFDVWPEGLKLRQIKADDTGADVGGAVASPPEHPWLKYGVPIVVAFITTVSITGVINLKKAIWPDYKVVITNPPILNGIATWSGNVVPLSWYLQPDQSSLREVKKDVVATVSIYTSTETKGPIESRPPLQVSVAPGTYAVSVDAPGAVPAQFQLVVEKSTTQSEQPDSKTKGSGSW